MTSESKTRPCCGHLDQRHLLIHGGGPGTAGVYLCLTGCCPCGQVVKRKPAKRRVVYKHSKE